MPTMTGAMRRVSVTMGLLLCEATSAMPGIGAPAQKQPSIRLLPLKVVGTQVLNSRNERMLLRGVNTACLEWTSDGEGHILDTVKTAVQDWKVNHIRLPLAQDRWFGRAPEQKDEGKAYRALVKRIVDYCAANGCYIMLDLHWSDAGEWGQQIGQHAMPDKNSVAFWKAVARTYKNHPAVLFDLYNEPHDVSWDTWLNGGSATENDRQRGFTKTYEAVGMQTLLDTVRSTGAKNVVVAGGLDWAYDMSGFLNGKQLSDPKGNGVLYANHNYPFKGDTFEQWLAKMEAATRKIPVIVSEFGGGAARRRRGMAGDPWIRQVLQALQDRQWHWTAWDMHPQAGPTLISDWSYTPTPSFGVYVRQALLGTLPPYTAEATAPTRPEEPPADPAAVEAAKAVVDRAVRALGGEEPLRSVKAASWKSEGTMTFQGRDSKIINKTYIQGLDHFRQEFEGTFGGNAVRGVTVMAGEKAWGSFNGNRREMDKDAVANQKRTVYLTVIPITLLPLKEKTFRIEAIDEEAVGGRPAVGLKVIAPDKQDFRLYFDRESGLPVRMVATVLGFMGEEFVQETTFGDYKEGRGIRYAGKIQVKRDGAPFLEQTITDFKVLDRLDPGIFAAP